MAKLRALGSCAGRFDSGVGHYLIRRINMKNTVKAVAFLVFMSLVAGMIQGCSVGISGGITMDGYYPDVKTAKGGGFGDPAASRHESVRPTTSHIRNNDGNSVDRFLKNFFDTNPKMSASR